MTPDQSKLNDTVVRLFADLLAVGDLSQPLSLQVKAVMKIQLEAAERQRGGEFYKTRESMEEERYLAPILCALTRDMRRIMNQHHHFAQQNAREEMRIKEKELNFKQHNDEQNNI